MEITKIIVIAFTLIAVAFLVYLELHSRRNDRKSADSIDAQPLAQKLEEGRKQR